MTFSTLSLDLGEKMLLFNPHTTWSIARRLEILGWCDDDFFEPAWNICGRKKNICGDALIDDEKAESVWPLIIANYCPPS